MAPSRVSMACAAAAVCGFAARELAFALPGVSVRTASVQTHGWSVAAAEGQASGVQSLGCIALVGAHAGLAFALYSRKGRSALNAAKETAVTQYKESAADARLFETVFMDYTSEYLKGPMYWHEDKLQGFLPDYPGTPMFKNGKLTSNATGNLKTFSSNELAFLSMLFFAIGLYGNLMFNYIDPQWARVDSGENFNVTYIVESFFLPISFFMHIACYIQKKNGK